MPEPLSEMLPAVDDELRRLDLDMAWLRDAIVPGAIP